MRMGSEGSNTSHLMLYNEGPRLIDALNSYKYRTGSYPSRVLVDQIYRTRRT